MRAPELRALLAEALPRLAAHEDELRDLDAALGDGDLGITVRSGTHAVVAALDALPDDAALDEVFRAAGKAFSIANPSTFAALVGGALLAAAKVVGDDLDREATVAVMTAAIDRIQERGKAELGDKTVLDALVPTRDLLAGGAAGARQLHELALARVVATAALTSARGRAAWVGERSVGNADPGATAYAHLLGALADSLEGRDA